MASAKPEPNGHFCDHHGERVYAIQNVDRMPPFFISVVSNVDHWLFVSSTGGLTAGRISPKTPLFPYITEDKIHDSWLHTGPKTVLRVCDQVWEPFNREQDGRFEVERNLYKHVLGNSLCFEEVNHDLDLAFRYTWRTSESHGFLRECVLENRGEDTVSLDLLDGLQNLLPANTPAHTQTNASNLVDAYKWSELHDTGLGLFTLYSGITDRAEPCESLRANLVYALGLPSASVSLSANALYAFREGQDAAAETLTRGRRGAYFVRTPLKLSPGRAAEWSLVADVEKTQGEVVALIRELSDRTALAERINASVLEGSDELARLVASADGFQTAAEENVTVHHCANVLFNILRGGIVDEGYTITRSDLLRTLRGFNRDVFNRNRAMLGALPESLSFHALLEKVHGTKDRQLERLCREYLPITFGRRHGDPSRPWNHFEIRLKDEHGQRLLSYQGNWRDIFQNWEALALGYPDLVENMIAKFVNASTVDGYNPYRVTKEGIDWEVEDPDDPWSYIGYWGDHQIIYLLKLLELSRQHHPKRLAALLHQPLFAYANVPYRIRPFPELLRNPKDTVLFDEERARAIDERVAEMGADGKLVLNDAHSVLQVTLLEKLVVPVLAKLANLVLDGGIWMNTQRPEWNDANNALVGQGLSMVTLYYTRRYLRFLRELLATEDGEVELSSRVSTWQEATAAALSELADHVRRGDVSEGERFVALSALGEAASRFRAEVYAAGPGEPVLRKISDLDRMCEDALLAIDHSIDANRRDDGLYHAYNLVETGAGRLEVDTLYVMLEGQVAALSAGHLDAAGAIEVLDALFASEVYCEEQHSFMLYPDRALPGFLEKNRVPEDSATAIPLVSMMLSADDRRIVYRDPEGQIRFKADLANVGDLDAALDRVAEDQSQEVDSAREPLRALFEEVFKHKEFTGRSGTMFGFEGLGSIYWHMVSKLLLAVQENFFAALDGDAPREQRERLAGLYYRVREGIGFNKTPAEYGAFPTDPYSHTPKHSGARQPGMTGQVKEEVLTRLGELGVRVRDGAVTFQPALLRSRELLHAPGDLCFLDVDGEWQSITIPKHGLGFTWCQVPILYRVEAGGEPGLVIVWDDGSRESRESAELPPEIAREIFSRSGRIRRLELYFLQEDLLT